MPVIALVLGLAASGVARSAPVSSAPTGGGGRFRLRSSRLRRPGPGQLHAPESRLRADADDADFVEPLAGIAIALLLLVSRLSARMRDLAHRVSRRRYFRVLVYLVLFSLVTGALQFPLTWYEDFLARAPVRPLEPELLPPG